MASLLAKGNIRSVYAVNGRVVIKLIHSDFGLRENIDEMYVYSNAPEWLKKWLCKPLEVSHDGLVMTMERGVKIDREEIPGAPQVIKDHDNKVENWVKINGQYKRCDYHQLREYV